MLPTTGLVGGCGIGLSLLLDAIVGFSPDLDPYPSLRAKRSNLSCGEESVDCFVATLLAMTTHERHLP
jgi:hypothetical protein